MKYRIELSQKTLPRAIRRNRRLIAAALSGIAVLIFSSGINGNQNKYDSVNQLTIPLGKSAIAIELTSELITAAISPGQKIDLISVTDGYASTVAQRAEILSVGSARSMLGGSAIELLIAVTPSEATKVATANQDGSLQVLLSATND